jgi:hypothetical protein
LISRLCTIDTPEETVQSWDSLGRQFMEAFVSRYSPEKFTPYMHVFVSHIGFFLKEYKEIESFANYDIETKNADNKGFVQRASNRFGGVADCAGIAVQQLEREYRMQELGVLLQPTEKPLEVTRNKRKAEEPPSAANSSTKRRKNASSKTAGWASKEIGKIDSMSFAWAKLIATNDQLQEEMQQITTDLEMSESEKNDTNLNNNANNNNNNNNSDTYQQN